MCQPVERPRGAFRAVHSDDDGTEFPAAIATRAGEKNGTGRVAGDALGDTAQKKPRDGRAAVRAHDDEIGRRPVVRYAVQDFGRGVLVTAAVVNLFQDLLRGVAPADAGTDAGARFPQRRAGTRQKDVCRIVAVRRFRLDHGKQANPALFVQRQGGQKVGGGQRAV